MPGGKAPVYYNPKQPTLTSLAPWSNPALLKIFLRFEFWFYLVTHVVLVALSITEVLPSMPVEWRACGSFQYFTTFFLTFYNDHCYRRYESLYFHCTKVMDSVILYVRELTVSFHHPSLWKHRLQASKYLLAACNLFFMGINGEKLNRKEWAEVVKKGLLTKKEAQMLIKYPGPEVVPVLTVWAMMCIGHALEQDAFHSRRNQKIAHVFNRLDNLMVQMMQSYRNISETMAMPIPFAYWHLMNLVFALNFFLLSLMLADLRIWLSIIPYTMALTTFMGLREVSNQLADPFGDDIVDFPLHKYLDHTFDQAACLLEAFSSRDAYERTRRQIVRVRPFGEGQVRRHLDQDALYYNTSYKAHQDGVFIWEDESPLQGYSGMVHEHTLQQQLRDALANLAGFERDGEAPTEEDGVDYIEYMKQRERIFKLEEQLRQLEDDQEAKEKKDEKSKDPAASKVGAASKAGEGLPKKGADNAKQGVPGSDQRWWEHKTHQWGPSSDAGSDGRPRQGRHNNPGSKRVFNMSDVKSFQEIRREIQSQLQTRLDILDDSDGGHASSLRSDLGPGATRGKWIEGGKGGHGSPPPARRNRSRDSPEAGRYASPRGGGSDPQRGGRGRSSPRDRSPRDQRGVI